MITLTQGGAAAIKEKMAAKPDAAGLRLNIKTTGCSGNSYKMEYAETEDLAVDDKFEQDGAILYIPKNFSWMLAGMSIDYKRDKMSEGFTFTNPNEIGRCGCGESFQVDPKAPKAP